MARLLALGFSNSFCVEREATASGKENSTPATRSRYAFFVRFL
jgi:hypothetical protein